MDDKQRTINKHVAKFEIERLTDWEKHAREQRLSMSRWILSSLLALNGGAAIAIFNNNHAAGCTKIIALLFFIFGLMAALLNGHFGILSIDSKITSLNRHIYIKNMILLDGDKIDDFEKEIERDRATDQKKNIPSLIAGWSSAIFFFIGIVLYGTVFLDKSNTSITPLQVQIVKSK